MDKKKIEKIMKLSRLELTPDEKNKLPGQMEDILEYMDNLNSLDTSSTQGHESVFLKEMALRPDEPEKFCELDNITQNASSVKEGFFKVKKVIK